MGVGYSTPLPLEEVVVAPDAPDVEMGDRLVRTRYFTFTRVNPKVGDYERLVRTCKEIDAFLSYKTVRDGKVVRLFGIIVLRGPSTISDDIGRLFPNFNLTSMGGEFDSNFGRFMESAGGDVVQHNEHPFFALRRALFN